MNPLSPHSGSIASRPVRQIPSSRRRGTAASDVPARLMGGRSQPLSATSAPMAVAPNRRDNILAARADGTFDAKVAAYNQAGAATGHSMDAAGNITAAPAPAPSGVPTPSVLPPTLKRPAAPRPAGLIDGQPAAQTLAALKTARAQVPRQTARNAAAPPAVQLPTVASAMQPPVTRDVTRHVTSPVTPPSPSRPGGMMAAAGQIAQGMQTAMTTTNPLAVVPRAAAINQTLQQRATTPTTPTPAGVPLPSPTFTGQQQDRYNTSMASISGANAPKPAAQPTQVITPKNLATKPTAQRSQLALGR
jgi:hypothetical protein